MCGDGTDEEDSGRWQPIIKSSFLYRWIHLTFVPDRVGDVEFPEVDDVLLLLCGGCEVWVVESNRYWLAPCRIKD